MKRVEAIKDEITRNVAIAALRGGTVIQLRAKEILLENQHYITGTLHRSITVQLAYATRDDAKALIGTQVHYARYVERLPDGGFLFRAAEEKLEEALLVAGSSLEEAMRVGAKK